MREFIVFEFSKFSSFEVFEYKSILDLNKDKQNKLNAFYSQDVMKKDSIDLSL